MKYQCPHCGVEQEINPAAMLGRIKSDKKTEASKRNGKKGGRPKVIKPTHTA